jgi:hypothetical protein
MKSAYELAMERLNKTAPMAKLTAEQKKAIAELDSKYAAKIAEREIFLKDKISKAAIDGNMEEMVELEQELARECRKFQNELEEKKEAVREKGKK